jgi:hypothetical protein
VRVFWVLHAGKHQLLGPRQHADEDMDDVCDEDGQEADEDGAPLEFSRHGEQ